MRLQLVFLFIAFAGVILALSVKRENPWRPWLNGFTIAFCASSIMEGFAYE